MTLDIRTYMELRSAGYSAEDIKSYAESMQAPAPAPAPAPAQAPAQAPAPAPAQAPATAQATAQATAPAPATNKHGPKARASRANKNTQEDNND